MKTDRKNPDTERIVIQLRDLLSAQEKILKEYLTLAEKEKETIISGDALKLFHYRELESEFIKKAEAYSKVIPSFNKVYSESFPDTDMEIKTLRASIGSLQTKLLVLNSENRKALEIQMGSIKSELEKLLQKKRVKPSPFRKTGNPSFIDTTA
ncbi:MAG: hypothetical protein JXB88_12580 [Spirochaetales bacterium]|nr:hypothetical protein [Spirochaetales bacterium]